MAKSTKRHKKIEELAYFKWLDAGCPVGDGVEFWVAAEKEVKKKTKKTTAVCAIAGAKRVKGAK